MNASDTSASPPPEVVEAFTSAALTTLQELTQIEAFSEEAPAVVAVGFSENLVLASVRLVRRTPGTMTLVLNEQSASRLAARYLPPQSLLTAEIVDDFAGEFANVIAGQAKTILKGTPYHFKLSTPTVMRSASIMQLHGVATATLVVSLGFEAGRLQLLVNLPSCPGA